jgi:GNAT superfamily N-acetyltransferase
MNPTATVAVTKARLSDVESLSKVIADAFVDLPPSRWLIGDRTDRMAVFPAYFALYVEHGINEGVVWTTPDLDGAGIWLPCPAGLADPPGYHQRLAQIAGDWLDRFLAFEDTLGRHHWTGREHDWLAILAVHPCVQGRGIGTALLGHHHELLDQAGQPGYLEAANLPDRDWYRDRGWRDIAEPFALPDDGPAMFPMTRNPNPGQRR